MAQDTSTRRVVRSKANSLKTWWAKLANVSNWRLPKKIPCTPFLRFFVIDTSQGDVQKLLAPDWKVNCFGCGSTGVFKWREVWQDMSFFPINFRPCYGTPRTFVFCCCIGKEMPCRCGRYRFSQQILDREEFVRAAIYNPEVFECKPCRYPAL